MRVGAVVALAGADLGIGRLGDLRRVASLSSDSFCWGKTRPVELRSHPLRGFKAAFGGFGGKGIRTPGLLIANETLYQLSYTPGKLRLSKHYRLVRASPATVTQALA